MKPRSRGVLSPKTLLPFRFVVPGLQWWHSHLLCMSNWVSSGPQPSTTSRCLWKEQEWILQGVPFTSYVSHQPKLLTYGQSCGLLCIVLGVNLEPGGVRCMPWQGEPVAILARFAWKMSCWHEKYHSTPPPSPFIGRLSPWKSTSNHGLVPINSEVQTNKSSHCPWVRAANCIAMRAPESIIEQLQAEKCSPNARYNTVNRNFSIYHKLFNF